MSCQKPRPWHSRFSSELTHTPQQVNTMDEHLSRVLSSSVSVLHLHPICHGYPVGWWCSISTWPHPRSASGQTATHTHKEKLIREDRSRSLQPASVLLTLKWVLSRCQQRWRLMTPPSSCLLGNNAYSSLSPTMLLLQPTQLTQTQTRTEVNGTSRVGKSSYFVPSTG